MKDTYNEDFNIEKNISKFADKYFWGKLNLNPQRIINKDE